MSETVTDWELRLSSQSAQGKDVIIIAVAVIDLVGMSGLFRGRMPKTKHSATIWGVYVKSNWRGYGIGQGLVRQCIVWADSQGVSVVKIGAITSNQSAIECYRKCGFVEYGFEPDAIRYAGASYDELLMAIHL